MMKRLGHKMGKMESALAVVVDAEIAADPLAADDATAAAAAVAVAG